MLYDRTKCTHCLNCLNSCPVKALSLVNDKIIIDHKNVSDV
ncbi:4Fe-4S binding protein [Coprobacillaceae bacterium CR2/5/TPMF4]|nr:4Fe-4S binding protein [Coprobacillaceae bacterium CR2/5/TPMF4]